MIYAGCSGYSFKEWVGHFYPEKTKAKEYLPYYATQLNSVEINHTFRRFPREELIATWASMTPESFRFSFKMHQMVTHRRRLRDVKDAVSDFVEFLRPLGPRLGVVLFQLPPNFKANLERLDGFLRELPTECRYAIEFRHESWNESAVLEKLRNAGVALCAAELEIEATTIEQTAPFLYVRLRKTPPYTDDEIETAGALIERVSPTADDVYLYAKHDDIGVAPGQVHRIASR